MLEDKTFALKSGEYTDPIRTKQGFVILKVVQHVQGGVQDYKSVEQDVEQAYYMSKMEPAIREYLTTMREQAFIDIKPGYVDSGASPNKSIYPISYAAYTPPQPKKKKKVERTRYRETTHTFRQKSPQAVAAADTTKTPPASKKNASLNKSEKPGKKEKIRFGKAPTKTLPNAPNTTTEDAGAVQTAAAAPEPEKTGRLNDPKELLAGLKARENLCSTAMPNGFALPHPCCHDPYLFETSFIVIGRTIQEIHFGASDGQPTNLFILVCCQDDRLHLHTLARLCLIAQETNLLAQIQSATDAGYIFNGLVAAEKGGLKQRLNWMNVSPEFSPAGQWAGGRKYGLKPCKIRQE